MPTKDLAVPPSPTGRQMPALLRILPISFVNFCTYLGVGVPLAILPAYVMHQLGYGPVLAGLSVSSQFLSTVVTRSLAGRMSDAIGARRTVLYGLVSALLAGLLLTGVPFLTATPLLAYAAIVASRLLLGFGESCSGTGTITWNIARVGTAHTAQVMSWGGVAAYGAIAAGAPLGGVAYAAGGLWAVGLVSTLAALLGLAVALLHAETPVIAGVREKAGRTLALVLPFGAALTLGAIGFGAVASFGGLMFIAAGWDGAALLVSVFGLCFAGSRVVFGGQIDRIGGFRVAAIALGLETIGLVLIWLAPAPLPALIGGALAGLGFGMVFPSLGVELMKRVPAASRGGALGIYTVFLDLALAITGPLAGLALAWFDYPGIFALCAVCAAAGIGMVSLCRAPREV
ncbi:MFS transporter [Ancylobacter sp. Lp-2]|uniref:MFS transporter n=1 Tax=Ancylobacter sp. Lp-2 TaxID=2881339 RepID=UPI001E4F60BC|nr:MFS transporter [Ancylobacter sp. Lp-2]MCB4768796.1 MFS transporter [Ancylobacter sp. Lp-2]